MVVTLQVMQRSNRSWKCFIKQSFYSFIYIYITCTWKEVVVILPADGSPGAGCILSALEFRQGAQGQDGVGGDAPRRDWF